MEPRWRRYLRFWGPDPAADFEDEIEFHLQTKIEDLVAAGMTPEAARREALRQFGPVRPVRRECSVLGRERLGKASRAECLAGWQRDVKYAGRMLWKTRASTAAAILILALGIGACTSVFTFLDRLLLAPLPVPKPGQLQLVTCMRPGEKPCRYDEYLLLRDSDRRFSGLAAEGGLVANERRGKEKIEHPAFGRSVSGNFFSVLGAQATLGRTLTPADDAPGAPPVAVATYDFWSRRYGRAPDVLGRVIYLNNLPFTIVGVLPRGLNGLNKASGPPLYITVGAQREIFGWDTLNAVDTTIFGRLKPGVSPRPATIAGLRVRCEDGSRGIAGTSGEKKRSLLLVGGIVALLLLMGCLNIACLLLARGAARQPEMAIRLSLGAGRGRIVRQSLIESCLVALAGGAAGMLVAVWANRLLVAAFQWKERGIDLALDWRVLGFGVGVSLLTALLFGIAPAIQFLRGGRVALNQERTVAPRFGAGGALVVVEVALSLVMVAGAAVFIRSFQNLRSVPTGFSAENVTALDLAAREGGEPAAADVEGLADTLRAAPRIEAAEL
ncbi:MAG: ABC transporter permease [Acidobacteriia bacterium]|nr:ABC transporter permease [Terriglobia bacterium]